MKNRIMSVLVLASICLSIGFMNPTAALALSCAAMPSVEEAFEAYDGIILGRVDEVVESDERNEIKITVSKSYKGIEAERIAVDENKTWGSLNGPSEVGEQYLFFLKSAGGKWENPLCSPTMKASAASEELSFLKTKEIPLNRESARPEPLSAGDGGIVALQDESDEAGQNSAARTATIVSIIAVILVGAIVFTFFRRSSNRIP